MNKIVNIAFASLVLVSCGGEEKKEEPKHEIVENKVKVEEQAEVVNPAIANLEKGEAFLAENAKDSSVTQVETGLQFKVLKEGNGDIPTMENNVTVHYHGTHLDGGVFDSSVERNEPFTHNMNDPLIKGWVDALLMMPEGSKWRVFMPANLAYGEYGSPPVIEPNETLIFEIELLSINK